MNCAFIYDLYAENIPRVSFSGFNVFTFTYRPIFQSAIVGKSRFRKKCLASGLNPHDVSDPRMTMSDSLLLYQYTLFQYHDYTL